MIKTPLPPISPHRCASCGATLPEKNAEGLGAARQTPPLVADDAGQRAVKLDLREKALRIREEAIEERESDFRRREALLAVQQGKTFALRVQEISDAQIAKATQEYRHTQSNEADGKPRGAPPVRDGEQ